MTPAKGSKTLISKCKTFFDFKGAFGAFLSWLTIRNPNPILLKLFHIPKGCSMQKRQPIGLCMRPSETRLGAFLRERRLRLGLSQARVGLLSGLSQRAISQFEVGMCFRLSGAQIRGLSKALGVRASKLTALNTPRRVAQPKTDRGRFLRTRREAIGLSIAEFARAIGKTIQQAQRMEMGNAQSLPYALAGPIAKVLQVEPSTLLPFIGPRSRASVSRLGGAVRNRRRERGWSLRRCADKLGIKREFLSQIELGKVTLSWSDDLLRKMSSVLRVPLKELKALRPFPKHQRRRASRRSRIFL